MTIINIGASAVYTKGFRLTEKIQLFGMAAVFLVLLYHSPAGLVLYWTCNNLFSLVKNSLQKTKHSRFIVYGAACFGAVLLAVFVLFFHHGALYKRIAVAVMGLSVFGLPLLIKYFKIISRRFLAYLNSHDNALMYSRTLVVPTLSLFLLSGVVVSSSLIASSVEEFSFIEQFTSPFPFILTTAEQGFGFFVLWVFCIYFLLPKGAKHALTVMVNLAMACCLCNTFLFSGKYGFLTIEMRFSEEKNLVPSAGPLVINLLTLLALAGLVFFLLCCRRKQILYSLQLIACLALLAAGTVNIAQIHRDFRLLSAQRQNERESRDALLNRESPGQSGYAPVYTFSKTGKNVLVIMLDRGLPGFVPYAFEEKPDLYTAFSGFTFFPNTVSFGSHTLFGAPPIFGGYEYTPAAINARSGTLAQKRGESFLVLPRIFSGAGFTTTVTDPPLFGETMPDVFGSFPKIKAAKVMDMYAEEWLRNHPEVQLASIAALFQNRLIYFSFLKCAPLVFRHYLYDSGRWLRANDGNTPLSTIESYSMLDVLPEITAISGDPRNTLTVMTNDLTHEPVFLQAPDYTIPALTSTNKGNGPFALEQYHHVTVASLLLLGKWFNWLKENGVYDNTRIIIVSDHGINGYSNVKDNIILPTGECLEFYAALLMFKDFDADGRLSTDKRFMTNADTPILAAQGIVENPVNPFTGRKLRAEKDGGVTITSSQKFGLAWLPSHQLTDRYDIGENEWLHVKDSIFDPQNWARAAVKSTASP